MSKCHKEGLYIATIETEVEQLLLQTVGVSRSKFLNAVRKLVLHKLLPAGDRLYLHGNDGHYRGNI